MNRILRAAAIILLVGVPSMLMSTVAIDLFGNAGATSIVAQGTRQREYAYLYYLGSYSYAINVGASHAGTKIYVAAVPIGDYWRWINNQTVPPFNSATIDGAGLFEFEPQKRGYYVISVKLQGEFDKTDFSFFYSFTRMIQPELLTDGLPLVALGVVLLVLSYAVPTKR